MHELVYIQSKVWTYILFSPNSFKDIKTHFALLPLEKKHIICGSDKLNDYEQWIGLPFN